MRYSWEGSDSVASDRKRLARQTLREMKTEQKKEMALVILVGATMVYGLGALWGWW